MSVKHGSRDRSRNCEAYRRSRFLFRWSEFPRDTPLASRHPARVTVFDDGPEESAVSAEKSCSRLAAHFPVAIVLSALRRRYHPRICERRPAAETLSYSGGTFSRWRNYISLYRAREADAFTADAVRRSSPRRAPIAIRTRKNQAPRVPLNHRPDCSFASSGASIGR